MARNYCKQCDYPEQTCLCHVITSTSVDCQISILQHPDEVKLAKNTARLVKLVIPETQVYVGESTDDFLTLSENIDNKTCLLIYPSPDPVIKIDETTAGKNLCNEFEHLLFIDATWRKAKKLFALNPWLSKLPSAALNLKEPSKYTIRRTAFESGLSTLEAVYHSLLFGKNTLVPNLLETFEAMVEAQMQFMPDKVKQRYQ